MDRTLTDRRNRHNLEITETAFGFGEDRSLPVIACDKRAAFARGSEATKQSMSARVAPRMDCFAEPCHHCASAIALVAGAYSGEP